MPKLTELEAQFYRLNPDDSRSPVATLAEAQGIMFLCPKCFLKNQGNVGTHSVICWFNGRGVPDSTTPGPGRWNPAGTGLDDLTFVPPGLTSVLLHGGCGWHGYVTNGEAVDC